MSDAFGTDDLARLIALEHAFSVLALISANNFAYLAEIKPSEAVAQFRTAVEGTLYDSAEIPKDVQVLMRAHLKRMFDQVAGMAKHADLGFGLC